MAAEPAVDRELALEHGLSDGEWELIQRILGRPPNFTELGITSALYSEHCSYKSSKVWLRQFPTSGEGVVHGPGENAGVVEIGNGWVAAFKMESHNHPSFIEPYQGAATGVGGILRDVFTMGARPIACMDSLRFGDIDAPRMRHLVDGVVRGIGDYGNCVGIPTVGGETGFHPSYNGNILVNAFALGVCRREQIFTAEASGEGNPILYVGSRTGRDGIHGATMASESFDDASEAKRPTVQVGDPFTEKVLLEACLEAMRSGAVVGIQDMGAAGMTSSCFEMADRGGVGVRIDLERVPLREAVLTPYEVMLSESQERMVIVAERGREEAIERVFRRWGLEVSPIGQVTASGRAELYLGDEKVADMPIRPLVDEAPVYERPVAEPTDLALRHAAPEVPQNDDPAADLRRLLATPELGDKSWIYRQYDSTVRGNTAVGPGADAAVLRIKGADCALALSSDVQPVYCYLDPRTGGRQAVVEAARNLACVGAEPLALTDCLNFGNPEIPQIAWQLRECIAGMAEACRALDVPVVSGNVSLYNQTDERAVHPTPTVAMVGRVAGWSGPASGPLAKGRTASFVAAGHEIVLLGEDRGEFGGSAYLRLLHGVERGRPPAVDLEEARRLHRLLVLAHRSGWIETCHDVSTGGIAVAAAEACFATGLGARIEIGGPVAGLYSESQNRVLVAVCGQHVEPLLRAAEEAAIVARHAGTVGGAELRLDFDGGCAAVEVAALREIWRSALPNALGL
ncbi:MAG: phosphoribosylformylglycinamidine synthase subunit PurL [Acidobacteria bacterium]|nr:MAG: phosphoribosylformylglycinamidine synthase subunit PurL [Acidobacteriota bacterium]REK12211.1 MAG: phosphoribosylformylglycinamidine synthase subunit PurL [Acidobacteriota bacterium]